MPEPTYEELKAQLEKLKADKGQITFKVSEKGAVSVYGLNRFPVTLYKDQWEKLLDKAEDLRAFILENAEKLTVKNAS